MAVNPGNQLLCQYLAEHIFSRLAPGSITWQHQDKRGDFTGCDQAVRCFRSAQPLPLILVVILPVDQVENRIKPVGLLIIAGRQVYGEVEGQWQQAA